MQKPNLQRQTNEELVLMILTLGLIGLWMTASGCGTAKVTTRQELAAASTGKPATIYVCDFDLDASNVKSETGFVLPPPKLPGPLGHALPPPPGTPKDPHVLAKDLGQSISTEVVGDLAKSGLPARRLDPGAPIPSSGWLVRGVFTEVSQGNQLHRAVIGFGAGKTDLQVVVQIDDLAQGQPKPFYEVRTTSDSGKMPGAGPMIAISPAGAAARFVLASTDLDRNVKQTASKIAEEVSQRMAGY